MNPDEKNAQPQELEMKPPARSPKKLYLEQQAEEYDVYDHEMMADEPNA